MSILAQIYGDNCRLFCLCSFFEVKETPHKVIDFIHKKIGKPTLPKDIRQFLSPRAAYGLRVEHLVAQIGIRVRYSRRQYKENIAKVKKYKLSAETKKALLEAEKRLPLWEKEYKKPDENRVFFSLRAEPRFTEKKLIRMDTLEKFLKDKELRGVLNLIEGVWHKPLRMTTCSEYEYEADKFKPIGGILLPTKIPLPAELGARFGGSELDGFSIRFKDSAMGLENIQISLEKETTIVVSIKTSYELTQPKEMLRKAYELNNNIANLLVEKVK